MIHTMDPGATPTKPTQFCIKPEQAQHVYSHLIYRERWERIDVQPKQVIYKEVLKPSQVSCEI